MTAAGLVPVVCCDLDGVLWRGDEAIAGSAEAIARLRDGGVRVAFFSNNSSQTVGALVEKLAGFGVPASPDDVLTSALAAAGLLRRELAPGTRVLACAGPGVMEALEHAGLVPVEGPPAEAVVVGWHRTFDFDRLDRAARAIREGARFVATNLDATYPIPGDLLPGAGAIVAAVATASGRTPEVAGKPDRPTVDLVLEHLGPAGLVVGDRPSTDGALADALGWPFALVLSGVTAASAPPGGEAIPAPPPSYVVEDLAALVPLLLAEDSTSSVHSRPR
jgi:HAD superfamily hydrolase (TIGR01450 family)